MRLLTLPSSASTTLIATTCVVLCSACGDSSVRVGGDAGGTPGSDAGMTADAGIRPDAGDPKADAGVLLDFPLAGRWTVRGTDSRGPYEGEIELVSTASGHDFTRVIRYTSATVEGGRELWWVWQGKATGLSRSLALSTSLKTADFVIRRGSMERQPQQPDVSVQGTFGATQTLTLTGQFTWAQGTATETWTSPRPASSTALFELRRNIVPAHDPPSANEKATRFRAYASFQQLPIVQPYTTRPEFQAAVHGYVVDTTDADFYLARPNALRVVNKVIDDISLAETLLRANAYRYSLAAKAANFDRDIETRFMDPLVGMIGEGASPSGPFPPSGDGALWTGTYVAAQAYRHLVTQEPVALANLLRSLDALLKLQEITRDWSRFARSLRRSGGPASPLWHAGTGEFAALEWLEGGNNDMLKGLFYGYIVAWKTLCTGQSGYESYCQRIKTNAAHLADDVTTERGFNKLTGNWLAAVVTGSAKYRLNAELAWVAGKVEIENNALLYDQGISDWSGNHLTFVGFSTQVLLAKELNLGGSAFATLKAGVDENYQNVARQRMAVWELIYAAHGSGSTTSPAVETLRWRLREIPYPKLSFDIDHRIDPEFCLSPYPSLPWKQDWAQYPTTDRTIALNQVPYFEDAIDTVQWKSAGRYTGTGNYEAPGVDYLHVYWYARRTNIIDASQ